MFTASKHFADPIKVFKLAGLCKDLFFHNLKLFSELSQSFIFNLLLFFFLQLFIELVIFFELSFFS
jgi:hypothetical protein